MTFIGYARTSSVGQENGLETQKHILEDYGCKRIFFEKVTGTSRSKRTELEQAINFLQVGDTLVVTKIDRLARSIIDLNNIVKELNSRGVNVKFIKDNIEFLAGNNLNSLQNLMFNILGSFAQFEREIIVERTAEGRERAKAQGKHMGRKGKPEKDIQKALKMYRERKSNELSVTDIVRLTGVPKSTIYARLKEESPSDQMEDNQ